MLVGAYPASTTTTQPRVEQRWVTSCMPCSFGLLPHPRSGTGAQPYGALEVTVTVRWIPLVTAAYGTLVAWPARRPRLAPGAMAPSPAEDEAPSSVTTAPWARARRGRGRSVA